MAVIALTTVGAFFAVAGSALAAPSSNPREGSDGNSVVCGGVPTKGLLIYYAKGGIDQCGHRDIKAIWLHLGINLKDAQNAKSEEVCTSNGNWQSSGRQHSLTPSMDHPVIINGHTLYVRSLKAWGADCYPAWGGTREDGSRWAVLKGCGNGETTHVPPKPHPVAKKPKKQVKVTVQKQQTPLCVTVAGVPLYSIPQGLQVINGVCQTNSNTSTQTGTTSGQGSPVINVNQTTQVNVNQNQGQSSSNSNCSGNNNCSSGSSTPPPPPAPTCQTPGATNIGGSLPCQFPQKPAPSCSFNTVQELDESNFSVSPQITSTTPVYLHCTGSSGDSLSITQHAGTGTLSSNSASLTANGSDQVTTVTYTAPTEPGTDTVSAHVVDNTTGKSTDVTVNIKIVAPNPNP